MSTSDQRPAEHGELCTCGRQAVTVFITDHGEIGYCSIPDGGNQSGPCPFCGAVERHRQPWGDPMPCPEYQLRPAEVSR